MAALLEILWVRSDALVRLPFGKGSLKKLAAWGWPSWREEAVTASALSEGGAVTRLSALIPDPARPG